MPPKKKPLTPDIQTTARGVTYTVPHLPFETTPPYDLSEATDWERQEIRNAWRDAQKGAREMMDCGILWIERLDGLKLMHATHMDASGGGIPIYGAQKLTLALVKLNAKLDGMHHRIAMAKKETS